MWSLNVSEVADLLGVSADTIRRLADKGHLPCHRLPSGYRRLDPGDVLRFQWSLRQRKVGADGRRA